MYCPSKSRYVPTYCYADSPIEEYLAFKNWLFRDSFIKRALWINDKSYHISDVKIGVSNLSSGILEKEIIMK